jgi:hypothetical protein
MTAENLAQIMHNAARMYYRSVGNTEFKDWKSVPEERKLAYYIAAQAALDAIAKEEKVEK